MIQFDNVTKRFGLRKAVEEISFQLPKGKMIGLIGENGSGKSTTLKLMSGLIRPTKGTITIDGQPVNRHICHRVSYLSELDVFYPFFTVGETLDFYDSQFTDFDLGKAVDIIKFMNLEQDVKVKHLSKGNRGRLKIALTLARRAPLLLMDEPLSGLDPLVRESIVKSLISYIDLGPQTVIITTHEIDEVEPLLDLVVLIKDGRVIGIEETEHLREKHELGVVAWMKEQHSSEKVYSD